MKKKTLSYLLLVLIIAFLAYYINKNSAQFKPLLDLEPLLLLAIAACHLSVIFMNGLFLKYIIEPYKKTISYGEGFFVALISTIGNYFLPAGTGIGVKAVYLKKKFDLNYSDFLSTLSGNYIIVFLINSGFGIIATLMLHKNAPAEQLSLLLAVLGGIFIFTLTLATYGFPRKAIRHLGNSKLLVKFTNTVSTVLRGWNEIVANKTLLLRLTTLTIGNFFLYCLTIFLAATALGFDIQIWALFLYSAIASLSLLLNITPGSIGLREAVLIVVGATLGLSISQIISLSIVVNGVLFFVLVISWALLQIKPIKRAMVPPAIQSEL